MYHILIIDDHSVVRRGIRSILQDKYPNANIDEAHSAELANKKIFSQKWHLIITDIQLPGRSGLEILTDIQREIPDLPVLVLSAHTEEEYALRVIRSGGAGFLNKDEAVDQTLVQAVETILSGRKYITPALGEKLASVFSGKKVDKPHETLSDRELEVFLLLSKGISTGEIAQKLSLSANTIGSFRRRILEKMQMKSNAELVTYAVRNHLI